MEWQPSGITALAFNPRQTHLTVARQNGDIEFWSVKSGWHLEKVFLSYFLLCNISKFLFAENPRPQRNDNPFPGMDNHRSWRMC